MLQNTKKVTVVSCPECHSTKFQHDHIHDETYCEPCGLVLVAPPVQGLCFPGYSKTVLP